MDRKLSPDLEKIIAVQALEQLVANYCEELDTTAGMRATQYLTHDCRMEIGSMRLHGHAEIEKFYKDFNRQVETLAAGEKRVTRHLAANVRIRFAAPGEAWIDALMLNFSAMGELPILNGTIPTIVSDVHLGCRRDAEGQWRIFDFTGGPVFVGHDPLQNKALME